MDHVASAQATRVDGVGQVGRSLPPRGGGPLGRRSMAEAESVRRIGENSSLPTNLVLGRQAGIRNINCRPDGGTDSLAQKRALDGLECHRACSDRRTRSRNGTPWNP